VKLNRLVGYRGCVIILVVVSAYSARLQLKNTIPSQGRVVLEKAWNGKSIKAVVDTREFSVNGSKDKDTLHIAKCCTGGKVPCSIIQELEIYYGERKILLPRLVYYHLSDLIRGELVVGDDGFNLKFQGGDGAETYCVDIEFDSTAVIQSTMLRGMAFTDTFAVTKFKYKNYY
jgi:hypothetical protein